MGLRAESGRFFFYPLSTHKAIAATCPPLHDHHRYYAASPLPDLHRFDTVLSECVAGWSPTDRLDRVDAFHENAAFLATMHQVIKRWAHLDGAVVLQARTVGTGWVHVCDERALPCRAAPDPDDIIGSVHVIDGNVQPSSFQAMPSHRLVSHLGPCRLPPGLFDKLVQELYSRLASVNVNRV